MQEISEKHKNVLDISAQPIYYKYKEIGKTDILGGNMATLSSYRQDKNLRQIDIAKKLKVSQSTVATWEKGENFPRPEMLLQLSKILEVDVEKIIKSIMKAKKEDK